MARQVIRRTPSHVFFNPVETASPGYGGGKIAGCITLGLIMKLLRILSLFLALLGGSIPAFAQASPYSISSKAQGAPFDLVATEIKRDDQKSYLKVLGFQTRTAPGARWLMCVYTDLAIKRGFSNWSVIYPEEKDDVLVVAFSNASGASPKEIFGAEYQQERVLGNNMMPTSKMMALCGMTQ